MARPLDAQQQRELTGFVNALYDAAGYSTTAEWARESDYPAPNLSNLRNGKVGIDGYNLLRLIRSAASRAGLSSEALAIGLVQAIGDGPALETIDGRLRELASLVTRALELLEAQDDPPSSEDVRVDRPR